MSTNLEKITPPKDLTSEQKSILFQHIFRRLADYRNTVTLYGTFECTLSQEGDNDALEKQRSFEEEINDWAQALLEKAWIVCHEDEEKKSCPKLGPFADTAMVNLEKLPPQRDMTKVLNTMLFLDVTTSKQYSSRTRAFLSSICPLDEEAISSTLKNPEQAIEEAQKKAEVTRTEHAERGKLLRTAGVGLAAIGGGLLIGITGGLAAPLVGAGVSSILGFLGLGGSIISLLASGLAGSSVVCGALFGVYGARSSASIVERHTKEVDDLALIPVRKHKEGFDTLAVRLCVTGWLDDKEDVTTPWKIFNGDDTLALQWEIKALEDLSGAITTLIKSEAIGYVKGQILKRTVLAGVMASMAPLSLLSVGQIIDNPWMNARSLAIKTGAVLGDLLANRVFGNRPVTLAGYSLGSLVIFEALKYLASLPPSRTTHIVHDVYLFGTPVSTHSGHWAAVRRVVAGRLVNGYSTKDYVLALLARASDATMDVAGIQTVDVRGVENVCCEDVAGHTMWKRMIGKYLGEIGAPGILQSEVKEQVQIQVQEPAEDAAVLTDGRRQSQDLLS
ncbi:DUF726-domain-containing protein [Crepidotus variabilis]|uniref:DUF726-domain-containing protein n=1 Tax=Crepidotus variabilis TaxID=179855 RepID=A0A9P6EDA1_9AGAR|nr:DUF726-domain-containing protein [Crepidotus variabilis]